MIFSSFINSLYLELGEILPGKRTHNEVSPYNRRSAKSVLYKEDASLSAVMLLIYPKDNSFFFVLIKRPEYNGVHGGQVSLPGGKKEHNEDLKTTALRETREELGLEETDIQVLGELTPVFVQASNFIIYPFVGFLDFTPVFTPDKREVEYVIEVPVSDLLLPENLKTKRIEIKTYDKNKLFIKAPYFSLNNQVVWGATAAILNEFKVIVKRFYQMNLFKVK